MIAEIVISPTLVYFSGLLALLAGLAILNVIGQWIVDWRVIITVFGWLSPSAAWSASATANDREPCRRGLSGAAALLGVAVLRVLGGFLSFEGYRPANINRGRINNGMKRSAR